MSEKNGASPEIGSVLQKILARLDVIEQRENLLEDRPDLRRCSVLLRNLVSAGRYNWSPRGEAPSLLRVGAEWKNLLDEKPTTQKYRFLIGGLSPQFNPPREESHLCYEGNE